MDQQAVQAHRPRRHGAKATRAELIRARIKDAADRLVRQGGPGALTSEALAAALCMRSTTFQSYVGTIDKLRDAVSLLSLGELVAHLSAAVGERVARDALAAYVEAQRLYAQARPGSYAAAVYALAACGDRSADALAAFDGVETEVLRAYRLPHSALERFRWCLRATVGGAIALEGLARQVAPLEADERFECLVAMLDAEARSAAQPNDRMRHSA